MKKPFLPILPLTLFASTALSQVETDNWLFDKELLGQHHTQGFLKSEIANGYQIHAHVVVTDENGAQEATLRCWAHGVLTVTGDRYVEFQGNMLSSFNVQDINDTGDGAWANAILTIDNMVYTSPSYKLDEEDTRGLHSWRVGRVALKEGTYSIYMELEVGAKIGSETVGTVSLNMVEPSTSFTVVCKDDGAIPAPIGTSYCTVVPNSTGLKAAMQLLGSGKAGDPLLAELENAPLNQFGQFVAGPTAVFLQGPGGSAGNLCVGGTVYRYKHKLFHTGNTGTACVHLETNGTHGAIPAFATGSTMRFQCWFRDGATSNYSDAVALTFL